MPSNTWPILERTEQEKTGIKESENRLQPCFRLLYRNLEVEYRSGSGELYS